MAATDDEMLREFFVDAKENLDALDQNLVGLERNPEDRNAVDNIFRSLHSLKGTSGFFEFSKLEAVAHAGENLLNGVREGRVRLDTGTTSLLLDVLDAIREILATIERTGREGDADMRALVGRLENALANGGVATVPPGSAGVSGGATRPERENVDDSSETIRVGVQVLDEMMDLVGELVLSRNQILQLTQHRADAHLMQSAQHLNRITTDLQERVMKTRMQPIKQVWSRLPRVVRDLSVSLGKRVRVEMEGKETELDRTLIEAIKDPLAHLVRNAIDHGIELPDVRVQKGKDPEGVFSLRAYHESGQVIIEIADDGAGIDPERVKTKAVEKGLLTQEQAAAMPAKEALHLVFRPGFSTAERITNISGRGVGMDVVRANIERIGGSIELESTPGVGTRFRIKIPLTLAIIPALMVTSGGESFAIPQVNVVELIRVKSTEVARAVETVQGTMATRLRGRLLTLVDLREQLAGGVATSPAALARRRAEAPGASLHIVMLQANQRKFGLIVDAIEESQEIVVKPLGRQVHDIASYAGATILGDGRVALILDTLGVAAASGLSATERVVDAQQAAGVKEETRTVLLVQDEGGARFAIPLEDVARLEKVPRDRIECVGGKDVLQYGDDILRLVRVEDIAPTGSGAARAASADHVFVVVLRDQTAPVGLVMDRVLDVAEAPARGLKPAFRPGVIGTAVVRERVTEFLDLAALRRAAGGKEAVAHV